MTVPMPVPPHTQSGAQLPPLPSAPQRYGDLYCPHCKSHANRRSSVEVTATFRSIFYQCANPFCGHSWKASLSYDYGLSPSAIPAPGVDLPLRPHARDEVMAALREQSAPAPDPEQPGLFDPPTGLET